MKLSRASWIAVWLGVGVGVSLAGPVAAGYCARPVVHSSWGWGYGWGGYGWGGYGWWSPHAFYGPAWGHPGWGYTNVYPNSASGGYGALDLDLSPERAEVWVDGERIGRADDYDGFPSLLWLEKGTYDVVFYLPGFVTLARQYTIYPGLIIDVEDKLARGEAIHPTDLGPKTTERRDARLEAEREIREDVERRRRAGELPYLDDEDDYETEEDEDREEAPDVEEPGGTVPGVGASGALDARAEPGLVMVTVEPDDASVYLDGRFLGTGRELAALRSGLMVDPGEHRLEVVRPGRQSAERTIDVESGRLLHVQIELDED